MEPIPAIIDPLAGKLQRIEDLAKKLVYIKWSREFFVLLLRASQDVLSLARQHKEYKQISALAEQLEKQISECLKRGELPKGAGRERLITLADALCRLLPGEDEGMVAPEGLNSTGEARTMPLFSRWKSSWTPEINNDLPEKSALLWLVAPQSIHELVRKIEQRGGFKAQFLSGLNEAHNLLAQSEAPAALIIDLDYMPDRQSTPQEIAALRQALPSDIPLFFLADRGDITARIEAVQIGCSGYFTKPIDIPILLEALNERILKPLYQRILVIDDNLSTAREIARRLDSQGMTTQVLAQPLLILQALYNFQPSLLILSLDLKDINGLTLAQAVHQHEVFRELPIILLSEQTDLGQQLSAVGLSGETLLSKPLNPELLFAAIAKQLLQKRNLYRKLGQINHYDAVSGLYNRPYFLNQLERALIATAIGAQPVAVMLIALDNLRAIENNDVTAADEILEQSAKRLKAALGPDTIAARFGDAVFTVLLGFENQNALLTTAHAVQSSLEKERYPLLNGGDARLRTSIGISISSATMCEAATLIQQSDLACSMARDAKDTRIYVHHGPSSSKAETEDTRQRRLLDEIREAVQQQRMNLLFQPIVCLRDSKSERYEVLLRMRNHEGWEILPETVFGLVKRHRIGMVLDRWVIAHSIRILRERQAQGQKTILFINISPTIVQDEELISWLQNGLRKTGVPAASLVFEITESTAELNMQAFQPFLLKLKELGCGISIDRFSGHERAQVLARRLRADYVKLNNSFTQNLMDDRTRQKQLTQLTQRLASLGICIIIIGIENAKILSALWTYGIDYVQGFFLQRPHTDMAYQFDRTIS